MRDVAFRRALGDMIEDRGIEEDIILLDDHTYDNSIIGLTVDYRVVYSFEKMVEEYMQDENCTEEEAIEWLEYNTLRAIPYFGERAPIIISDSKKQIMDFYDFGDQR